MNKRLGYTIALLILLGAELLIGAFVKDAFLYSVVTWYTSSAMTWYPLL